MRVKHYWGYRINTEVTEFFRKELDEGRLRQGWGTDERQNLRNEIVEGDVRRNLRMLHEVKEGDILLIPRLPEWEKISIVEAVKDWDTGYQFKISEKGDYGHIFPAKLLMVCDRNSEVISKRILSSMRAHCRFLNMDYLQDEIEKIINM